MLQNKILLVCSILSIYALGIIHNLLLGGVKERGGGWKYYALEIWEGVCGNILTKQFW